MTKNKTINKTIDHLFRQEYAKLVSFLTSKFGPSNIDIIEDAVQDSLYKAMQLWSYQEMPAEPGKWLYRVAHNTVIDGLRKSSKSVEYNPEIGDKEIMNENFESSDNIEDEQLKMIFACCHPSMKEGEQIMLSLKLLCGFSNKEISRALFKEPEAVKKALTRAKVKFKTEVGQLQLPEEKLLRNRIDAVLKVIYLLFTNGYTSYEGDSVLKKDVCEDAMRLAGMLYKKDEYNTPQTKALLALMCFNFSRFDARIDEDGNLLTMEQQNWSLWDNELIKIGLQFISESADGANISNYHLEAAIAREYSVANNFGSIDWKSILTIYNLLVTTSLNPTTKLNRLVVLEKVEGAKNALKELLQLDENDFSKNHLFYAIKADFEKKLNKISFKNSLEKAIALTANQKEKDFLRRKL